jgi:hypothetical protein
VFIEGALHRIGHELHFLLSENIAFPRLRALHGTAAGEQGGAKQNEQIFHYAGFHFAASGQKLTV